MAVPKIKRRINFISSPIAGNLNPTALSSLCDYHRERQPPQRKPEKHSGARTPISKRERIQQVTRELTRD
jgi:hypothetical protein